VRGRFKLRGPGRITIGDDVTFEGMGDRNSLWAESGGTIAVGDRCFINGLTAFANTELGIGSDCIIGNCWITTSDFHAVELDRWSASARVQMGPVSIRENVWLAHRTAVLQGVTVGAGSVVAYGTVVASDVDSGVVVAGQQLRVVRRLQ
jgi:acetyltransferase-like isoleucine patch superfamily enzyme